MADQSEVDRVLAQYGQGLGGGAEPERSWWDSLGDDMRARAAKSQSELWRDFGISALMAPLALRAGGHGTSYNHISEYLKMMNAPPPVVPRPPSPPPSAAPAATRQRSAMDEIIARAEETSARRNKADGGEVLDLYGQGYTSPALNSGDGEIASTPDILAQYGASERMASGVPGFLRRIGAGLRSLAPSQVTTPVNTLTGREPPLSAREAHANPALLMAGEGADTMASWMDMHPGVDRGQSRPQDLLAPLGMSALGMPFAVPGAVGVFGGRLARTADQAALRRAEEMATSGADRRAIWDETGWFQGRDGQWRFEIDDSGMRAVNPQWETRWSDNSIRTPDNLGGAHAQLPLPVRTGQLFDHPELARNYPSIMDTPVDLMTDVSSNGRVYRLGQPDEAIWLNTDLSLDRAPSIALHELQHIIQRREGFAPGGNQLGVRSMPEFREVLERTLRESEADGDPPISAAGMSQLRDLIADKTYRELAGEVEARNVQTRQRFTPDERRARPPWETQDVPDADQILRQYSSGPQMSTVGRFTDPDGYSIRVEPRTAGMNIGDEFRRGQMLITNPQGREVRAGYWMDQPERGWTHQDVDLFDDWVNAADKSRSVWASLPLERRLAMEAEHQATAYRPLREQFAEESRGPPIGPTADDVLRHSGPQLSTKGPSYALSENMRADTPGEFGYAITRDGKQIGTAVGHIIMEDGQPIANISWIGGALGERSTLGREGLMQIREAFRRDFPEVNRFEGIRVSGAHAGERARPYQSVTLKGGDGPQSPIGPTADDVLRQYSQGPQTVD